VPDTITIRDASRADLDAIVAIEQECFSDAWPRSVFAAEIASELPPRVAVLAEQVMGYLCLMQGPEELHITNIAVANRWRRRGVARALMSACLDIAVNLHCRWIYLDVRPSNQPARALYRRFGFVEIFRRRKYYIKPAEDGLVLARSVAAPKTRQRRRRDGTGETQED
jgi:ribosomal-protein-alanine N-acetyltransferase